MEKRVQLNLSIQEACEVLCNINLALKKGTAFKSSELLLYDVKESIISQLLDQDVDGVVAEQATIRLDYMKHEARMITNKELN